MDRLAKGASVYVAFFLFIHLATAFQALFLAFQSLLFVAQFQITKSVNRFRFVIFII